MPPPTTATSTLPSWRTRPIGGRSSSSQYDTAPCYGERLLGHPVPPFRARDEARELELGERCGNRAGVEARRARELVGGRRCVAQPVEYRGRVPAARRLPRRRPGQPERLEHVGG